MKIYFAGHLSSMKTGKIPKIGLLISYFGLKKLVRQNFCNDLFLDSGAFSAWTQKKEIDIRKYIKFIRQYEKEIDIFASLDDITSFKTSITNYRIMKLEGLDPLPCFHYGEPFWVLEKYLKYTNYIALGGIAKKRKRERINWLHRIFKEYSTVNFHGFGIQDRQILLGYSWKSVDSSSAHTMARFGGICTPWGDYKINPKVNYKDLKWITPLTENKIKNWVESLGVNYEKAKENSMEGFEFRLSINFIYYKKLAKSDKQLFNLNMNKGFDFKETL